jgi:hypothetical protein
MLLKNYSIITFIVLLLNCGIILHAITYHVIDDIFLTK